MPQCVLQALLMIDSVDAAEWMIPSPVTLLANRLSRKVTLAWCHLAMACQYSGSFRCRPNAGSDNPQSASPWSHCARLRSAAK
ncbi:hypothetical protein IE81DRAFT_322342 [Ceraceosorus guamensis]|uniref:Secreted protein n=1 Tax=Ceraceosorus guamensis TaxID=1522189 RepID=A0A316W765_9BASI|nr:hypothetical protein IE81DRAFT_322342 [Ceraceosorus guamensis]PWN43485.1 hypothetical protein IE81DRAFT_322342 [Ceraceosorus guamensis]